MKRVEKNDYKYWIIRELEANERYLGVCLNKIENSRCNEDVSRWITDMRCCKVVIRTLKFILNKSNEESN